MARIVLVADDCASRAAYLENCQLPSAYMEDFSIQGFTVREYEQALALLMAAGYRVQPQHPCSADVEIVSAGQLAAIHQLLLTHGIQAQLSDIADTMYQA